MNARLRRRAAIALAVSAVLHACVALVLNLYHQPKPQREPVMVVGEISIERRPPALPPPPAPAKHQSFESQKSTVQAAAPAAAAPQTRIEESRITPRARSYQPKVSHSRVVSQNVVPQVDFEQTLAKLRAQNNPVAGAQRPVDVGSHTKNYSTDFSTSVGTGGVGNGYLDPIQSWRDEGFDYYRVRYTVEYPDGTTEEGIVPWPIRFLPQNDPFRLGIHRMPLPLPLGDFMPPPGTVMHPLVAYCWKHREELASTYGSCPIAHD